tara:strand:+ start:49 stop:918 length:870 start_codon:yes stop_codon:yes gene_type:complete
MEEAVESQVMETQEVIHESVEPEMPESFNLFSEEDSPVSDPRIVEELPAPQEQPKSKQFLENVRRDKAQREQSIILKQREQALSQKEKELSALNSIKEQLQGNPEEFFRSQGIDPSEYYRNWTQRLISGDGESDVMREVQQLKAAMAQKDQLSHQKEAKSQQDAAFGGLCQQVEHYAVKAEGYPIIKETCTAQDVVNGMLTHYKNTGEEISIEEAFEKIETGLRQREESFYKDPKIMAKLQRYNPEAMRTAKSPSATLSSRFQQQPTRTSPDEMSYEEIREMYKGKLFT